MLRRVAGLVMLGLGVWLGWGALEAILRYVDNGATVQDYFLDPQTGILSILRVSGSVLMAFGGALTLMSLRFSATVSVIGALVFSFMGLAMLLAGADQSLWMTDLMYGLGAVALSVLILTLRRA